MIRTAALALVLLAACASAKPPPVAPANTPPAAEPSDEAPPSDEPAPEVRMADGRLVLSRQILFDTGTAVLKPESDLILEVVYTYLTSKPDLSIIRIEGHSDSQGMTEANQKMTEDRAAAVARALVARGLDCTRVLPVGFGETKPIADNATAEGRAQNRRIELVPAALRGHPIGGMPVDGGGRVAGDPCSN